MSALPRHVAPKSETMDHSSKSIPYAVMPLHVNSCVVTGALLLATTPTATSALVTGYAVCHHIMPVALRCACSCRERQLAADKQPNLLQSVTKPLAVPNITWTLEAHASGDEIAAALT